MDKEIKKFFELYVGYDGQKWDENNAKKHLPVLSYFQHDMERMIKEQVGYPSVLYALNFVAFLGYCLRFDAGWNVPKEPREKKDEFERIGKVEDFEFFCDKYLSKINKDCGNKDLMFFLFDLVRHRLSHTFFVHNFITTFPDQRHLKIQKENPDFPLPHIWISVSYLFEDIKKAIELAYNELESNEELAKQFAEKQKFILEWTWKLQEILKNIKLENTPTTTIPTSTATATARATPINKDDQDQNVSGSCYTPPQIPPKDIL